MHALVYSLIDQFIQYQYYQNINSYDQDFNEHPIQHIIRTFIPTLEIFNIFHENTLTPFKLFLNLHYWGCPRWILAAAEDSAQLPAGTISRAMAFLKGSPGTGSGKYGSLSKQLTCRSETVEKAERKIYF